MTRTAIQTPAAPGAIGPYSQAVRHGQMVFLSGQIPLDPATMTLVTGDFTAEAMQVFENLRAVATAAGGSLADSVKLTIYLTDLANFAEVNEVMTRYFEAPYPARATVQVSALPRGARVEVDAILCL
jgi:reactive intermediate/imine deaminase